ncbi:hypothetical protein HPB47_006217 [Ixodes persulcatus]|uniref:Uncharacterized protein n=1 Tax=Ixodes persulcatus TaxID=34615 RepID=A0AC60PAU1_IXOPE|nr:hypothetical protein HPB47_006217 [Ixodes persulcatus]
MEHVATSTFLGYHRLHIINSYWLPNQPTARLPPLDMKLGPNRDRDTVVTLGDFNSNQGMTLLNDTTQPTRTGGPHQTDTSPDLTWIQFPLRATWENTGDALGSDHQIIEIKITPKKRGRKERLRTTKLTAWYKHFGCKDWTEAIQETVNRHTKHIANTEDHPTRKSNRTLKARILALTQQSQEYAEKLASQNWMQLCDDISGQIHTVRAWHIFRAIMGHRKPRNTLKKLMLSTGATVKDLIGEIRDTFYPDETQTMAQQIPTAETRLDQEVQTALESEELDGIDSDFTDAELQTALFQLKRNTAPGPDKITYGMLRNIPDNKLDELLLHINEDGKSTEWTAKTVKQLNQIYNMIARITRYNRGMKEHELRKIVEATAYSRVLWSYPYTQLTQTQKRKIKAVLRKCHRLELGTPKYAASALVNATAIHNTLEEKSEIQQDAQRHRLATSQQGRKILSSLGYSTERLPEIPTPPPPWESIPHLTVRPIPKHMHPEVDSERRKCRATHLKDPGHDIYYTDASFTNSNATTASVGPKGHVVRRHANVPSATAAEIQAIAEAATLHSHTTKELTIRTDSQDALRAYAKNDLPEHILGLLTQYMTNHPHLHIYLEWVRGHQAIEGNERAHALSRDNTEPSVPIGWPQAYDPREDRAEQRKKRRTFLKKMREEQRKFPTPLPSTSRRQATSLSRVVELRPSLLPCDMTLHYIHNLGGLPSYQVCGAQPPDNSHTYWECPRAQNSPFILEETLLPLHIPHTWESWAAPPQDLQATLWQQLQNHVEHVLGLTPCNNNEHAS